MLCRICLEESSKFQAIFEESKIIQILEKFFVFEHKILKNDPVSTVVCNKCWCTVKKFNNFHTKIENSQVRYTELKLCLTEKEEIKVKDEITYESDFENYLNSNVNLETINYDEVTIKVQQIDEDMCTDPKPNENLEKINTQNESTNINMNMNKKEQLKINRNSKRKSRSIFLNNEDIDRKIASFMTLSCDICGENLKNLASLKSHFKSQHDTVGYIICCNKKFTQNHFLVGHIDNHLNPQNYKCIECNKILSTKKNYEKHMSTKHFRKQWFFCEHCPRKFESITLLDRHKPMHLPKDKWNFKCPRCDRTYPSDHYLNAHIIDIHERKNICQHCGKSFSTRKFKQHQRTHTEDPDKLKVQCEICGAWLKTPNGYRTHMINHKDASIIHKCSQCGKISPNRAALKIHLKNHETAKNHQCTVCEKAFKRPLALRQHMATHTGEFLYQCSYCSKTFIYDSAFHTHKKRDHPIEYEVEKLKIRRTDFTKYSTIHTEHNLDNIEQNN